MYSQLTFSVFHCIGIQKDSTTRCHCFLTLASELHSDGSEVREDTDFTGRLSHVKLMYVVLSCLIPSDS